MTGALGAGGTAEKGAFCILVAWELKSDGKSFVFSKPSIKLVRTIVQSNLLPGVRDNQSVKRDNWVTQKTIDTYSRERKCDAG